MGDFHSRPPAAAAVPISPSFRRQSILGHAHQIFSQEVVLVQFSWVQFSLPLWTELATAVAGSWQSRTGDGRRQSLQLVAGFHPTTDIALIGQECAPIAKNLRRPPISSPNRRGLSQVQCTAGNWTERKSWVELSSVFRCVLGLSRPRQAVEFTLLPICSRFRQQSTFNKVDRVEFNFVASVYHA